MQFVVRLIYKDDDKPENKVIQQNENRKQNKAAYGKGQGKAAVNYSKKYIKWKLN